jgi:hypothetical protein
MPQAVGCKRTHEDTGVGMGVLATQYGGMAGLLRHLHGSGPCFPKGTVLMAMPVACWSEIHLAISASRRTLDHCGMISLASAESSHRQSVSQSASSQEEAGPRTSHLLAVILNLQRCIKGTQGQQVPGSSNCMALGRRTSENLPPLTNVPCPSDLRDVFLHIVFHTHFEPHHEGQTCSSEWQNPNPGAGEERREASLEGAASCRPGGLARSRGEGGAGA